MWPSVLSPLRRSTLVCTCTCTLTCQASHQTCTTTQIQNFPLLFPKPGLDMICSGHLCWAQICIPCSVWRAFSLQTDTVCWVILYSLCLQASLQPCPLAPGSSRLLPSCCSSQQPGGHTLPQLDLGLMAAHASAGCCLAVGFCTFLEWSLYFCLSQQTVKENTPVLPAWRLASTVQWKGSVADSGLNLGYKGRMTWVVAARGAVVTVRKDNA